MTQREPLRGKPGLVVVLLVLAAVVVTIDQVTKLYAVERLQVGGYVPVVGDYLGWQLHYNDGAAFSLATGMTWLLTIVAVVVVVVVLRVSRRLRSRAWTLALGLLLGGAGGNLVDRLVREPGFGQGHVVDFINYNGWFIGNVADIAIVLAAVMIAILALVGLELDGRRAGADEDSADDDAAAADEESLLSEEPAAEDDQPASWEPAEAGDVDLAGWVADSEPAAPRSTVPGDLGTSASPPEPADGQRPRPRWRSRREMRTATTPEHDDG